MRLKKGYRYRKLGSNTLLTADHGAWLIINNKDFSRLQTGHASRVLINKLNNLGLIHSIRNREKIVNMFKLWHSKNKSGPILHIIELTKRCNLHCTYCHASAFPVNSVDKDLKFETAQKILEFIVTTPSKSISLEFQGGESLLNWNTLTKVIEYSNYILQFNRKKFEMTLVTNATLLTKAKLRFLTNYKVNICTSIDGPKRLHDIHRRNSNNKGTFDTVINKLELAKENNLHIPFISVLTKQSIKQYRQIVDFYINCGNDNIVANHLQPLGFAKSNWNDVGYDWEMFVSNYRSMLDYTFEKLNNGIFILERQFALALDKVYSLSDITYSDFRNPCGAVYGQIAYDINGIVYPCDEARGIKELALGSVYEHNYYDISKSKLAKLIHKSSIPDENECRNCAYKPFCGICPVVTFSETGDFTCKCSENFLCQFNIFLFDYLFKKIIKNPKDIRLIRKIRKIKEAFHNMEDKLD